ncbi:hypothetical protein [Streptomyces soliscabiei]|uniref:hypothetical protein n=1 Tax=Streptomyces soliscabiei TaxID=588897 RepID=UPI0029B11930|nr:hypothetical protein [Streptomyces sp. NY05-11A]MDX2679552.1 hypothetical protein [Streptomyces sp. NY05-11A]
MTKPTAAADRSLSRTAYSRNSDCTIVSRKLQEQPTSPIARSQRLPNTQRRPSASSARSGTPAEVVSPGLIWSRNHNCSCPKDSWMRDSSGSEALIVTGLQSAVHGGVPTGRYGDVSSAGESVVRAVGGAQT